MKKFNLFSIFNFTIQFGKPVNGRSYSGTILQIQQENNCSYSETLKIYKKIKK